MIQLIIMGFIIAASVIFSIKIPDIIMKYKNKTDIDDLSKAKKYTVTVLACVALVASEIFILTRGISLFNWVCFAIILTLSATIIIVDTRCRIIPNLCLFPMLLTITVYLIYNTITKEMSVNIIYSIIGMIMMCFMMITVTNLLGFKGYLGAGDIKYFSVAAYLFTLTGQIVGMLTGLVAAIAIYMIPMLIAKKITMKSMIAFGPFIGFGVMFGICWMLA